MSNDEQGLGFAFFCWHNFSYPGHIAGSCHAVQEQRVCRSEFREMPERHKSRNIPALERVGDKP